MQWRNGWADLALHCCGKFRRAPERFQLCLTRHFGFVIVSPQLRLPVFFQIGGGIAGDFPICVVPMLEQDVKRAGVRKWAYFCQISDSTTSYGSYSGAVPNEKITWGKLAADTPRYLIESDASIVAPLIFAQVLGQ